PSDTVLYPVLDPFCHHVDSPEFRMAHAADDDFQTVENVRIGQRCTIYYLPGKCFGHIPHCFCQPSFDQCLPETRGTGKPGFRKIFIIEAVAEPRDGQWFNLCAECINGPDV